VFKRLAKLAATLPLLATHALAAGTVTLTLESPQNGQIVAAGAKIDWTIRAETSTGDNLGLALLATDLVQDATNPALLNLPPGDANSIPSEMSGFDRPGGITNPGENGAASGYIGVQRGTDGQKNLVQIGGGQNTFGQAGSNIGKDVNVDGAIGQTGPQQVLSGSFHAPAAPGTYTYRLKNSVANVLDTIGTPPDFSVVSAATVDETGAVISLTVSESNIVRGDMNCDGSVDFNDIDPFVSALISQEQYENQYPDCNYLNADINQDGSVDFNDIDGFVECLINGGCP
jgi:hypothetical protein